MKLGPYELNQIVTGDARELARAIPDESVDLIFTDPPYPKEYLYLFDWLAEIANRILTPNGLMFIMSGQSYLPQVYNSLSKSNLDYWWTFNLSTPGEKCNLWNKKLWKPIIAYCKGIYSGRMLGTDVVQSTNNDKRYHHWGQSVASAFWAIERYNGIVFDPFAGGGTVPAVCKMLGRDYLAFEIDPATADNARRRVELTQPPLFVMQPEQLTFDQE